MQQTALDIWNTALSAVHAKGRLASLTANKPERYECELWYDVIVRSVQEAAFWPCCKATEALTGQISVTNRAFAYSYSLPYDCLRPRYLMSFMPFDLQLGQSFGEVQLFTDDAEPHLVYSIRQDDVTLWSPSQIMASAYGLAGHIAGPLTGRGELIQKNINLANSLLIDAQAASINSDQMHVEFVPDTLKARGYSGPDQRSNFYYPFGGLFSGGNSG
jgi:hypothetical protein